MTKVPLHINTVSTYIMVMSEDMETHRERLDLVLSELEDANLKIKLYQIFNCCSVAKSQFFKSFLLSLQAPRPHWHPGHTGTQATLAPRLHWHPGHTGTQVTLAPRPHWHPGHAGTQATLAPRPHWHQATLAPRPPCRKLQLFSAHCNHIPHHHHQRCMKYRKTPPPVFHSSSSAQALEPYMNKCHAKNAGTQAAH
nr:uncharacterized protein LOC128696781 [Cherax quadricarinatus]